MNVQSCWKQRTGNPPQNFGRSQYGVKRVSGGYSLITCSTAWKLILYFKANIPLRKVSTGTVRYDTISFVLRIYCSCEEIFSENKRKCTIPCTVPVETFRSGNWPLDRARGLKKKGLYVSLYHSIIVVTQCMQQHLHNTCCRSSVPSSIAVLCLCYDTRRVPTHPGCRVHRVSARPCSRAQTLDRVSL